MQSTFVLAWETLMIIKIISIMNMPEYSFTYFN